MAQVKGLVAEYAAAEMKFNETDWPKEPTPEESIHRYEVWPAWKYIPRFVKLAEAAPGDEAASLCCDWILDRTDGAGNQDKESFAPNEKAWQILAEHHLSRRDLPMLCLRASSGSGSAREHFLRAVIDRPGASRETRGIATLALAQFFATKYEIIEFWEQAPRRTGFGKYVDARMAAGWKSDLVTANSSKFKAESIRLFREVLANYADVPLTISAPYFRDIKKLSDKATKSLHALEHLTVGSPAPTIMGQDLHGQPLDLNTYRGRVMVLTFWFTGCGPCMGMIPQEKQLVKKYRGRPFTLLSICTDESRETAQKTAADHKMDWPCWFDGQNGPIARNWNVLAWPSIYLLDERGIIVAKNLRGEALDAKVAKLMDRKGP
jgi:thiol-disulfide isomerase/thioredoxin